MALLRNSPNVKGRKAMANIYLDLRKDDSRESRGRGVLVSKSLTLPKGEIPKVSMRISPLLLARE